jgi:hypothetical protein
MNAGAIALAGLVGLLSSSFELLTTKYPQTYFLVLRAWQFWALGIIYALLAAGGMMLLSAGVFSIEGLGLKSPFMQAVVVGLSLKALLHVRVWTVHTAGDGFPIGTETLVQIFEPWLSRQLLLDEFNRLRGYLQPKATKYPDLALTQKQILANIPPLPTPERSAFVADVNACTSVEDAMELCLRRTGRSTLERIFPA